MTTAEALEALNDAGKFEILATRVLRLIDPESSAIEHIGVNASGKTIRNRSTVSAVGYEGDTL